MNWEKVIAKLEEQEKDLLLNGNPTFAIVRLVLCGIKNALKAGLENTNDKGDS